MVARAEGRGLLPHPLCAERPRGGLPRVRARDGGSARRPPRTRGIVEAPARLRRRARRVHRGAQPSGRHRRDDDALPALLGFRACEAGGVPLAAGRHAHRRPRRDRQRALQVGTGDRRGGALPADGAHRAYPGHARAHGGCDRRDPRRGAARGAIRPACGDAHARGRAARGGHLHLAALRRAERAAAADAARKRGAASPPHRVGAIAAAHRARRRPADPLRQRARAAAVRAEHGFDAGALARRIPRGPTDPRGPAGHALAAGIGARLRSAPARRERARVLAAAVRAADPLRGRGRPARGARRHRRSQAHAGRHEAQGDARPSHGTSESRDVHGVARACGEEGTSSR